MAICMAGQGKLWLGCRYAVCSAYGILAGRAGLWYQDVSALEDAVHEDMCLWLAVFTEYWKRLAPAVKSEDAFQEMVPLHAHV